jgi:predicted transposase YbfD/YdcC
LIDRLPESPGCVLTFDALHAVGKTMEKTVIGARADFLVQVKGNTADLRRRMRRALVKNQGHVQRAETLDADHGRIERRRIEMVPTSPPDTKWPHTHTVCRVTREREVVRRQQTVSRSQEQALYVGSFAATTYGPQQVLRLTRAHWSIENGLHHRKDRSMDEDRCRAAERGIGRVMCCIRSLAALVLGRAKESFSVVRRRFSRKTHLILGLLSCTSLAEWERSYRPYRLA